MVTGRPNYEWGESIFLPLKNFVERAAVRVGLASLALRFKQRASLVLAYHNVVDDQDHVLGDRSLHLKRTEFRRQVVSLLETHRVVPLADVLTPPSDLSGPRVAITFDDAYHGAVSLGLSVLAELGLPATVFVTPGFLNRRFFWWDRWVGANGFLSADTRHTLLQQYGGSHDEIARNASVLGLTPIDVPEVATTATESELRAAVANGLVTLGAHTWSHPNLTALDDAALGIELREPMAWLQDRFGDAFVPLLAYPYGIASPAVESAVERAGYRGAFRVDGGWFWSPFEHMSRLPRFNVPAGISLNGFRLRASGIAT